MPGTLRIGNPEIVVRLRRNARARRMILRVARPGGAAVLTLPPRVPLAQAQRFAEAEEAWLRGQLASLPPWIDVGPGTVLPFADGRLEVAAGGGQPGLDGALLRVPGALPGPQTGARVAAYLREAARTQLVAAVDQHAAAIGRSPGRITLRDPRARWGSCTSSGDLMFSWRLIMAPGAVLDYVAAHEVAHLAELNHGPRFWALVAQLVPGHDPLRRWLRQNGSDLRAYRFHPA